MRNRSRPTTMKPTRAWRASAPVFAASVATTMVVMLLVLAQSIVAWTWDAVIEQFEADGLVACWVLGPVKLVETNLRPGA